MLATLKTLDLSYQLANATSNKTNDENAVCLHTKINALSSKSRRLMRTNFYCSFEFRRFRFRRRLKREFLRAICSLLFAARSLQLQVKFANCNRRTNHESAKIKTTEQKSLTLAAAKAHVATSLISKEALFACFKNDALATNTSALQLYTKQTKRKLKTTLKKNADFSSFKSRRLNTQTAYRRKLQHQQSDLPLPACGIESPACGVLCALWSRAALCCRESSSSCKPKWKLAACK